MSKKLTREEFIEKAKQVHGDTYDYSNVNYINNHSKVLIICKEHGVFEQRPDKHLLGQGCPNCSNTKVSTTDLFIEKAINIHGDTYDYSTVEYVNNRTPIKIICREHGEFLQTPHNHLKGQGCPTCGLRKQSVPIVYDEFLSRSKSVHEDKYIYPSEDKYKNIQTKIPIICPKHGEFKQMAYLHTLGSGCPKCANELNGFKKRSTTEEFIEKAQKIHGNKYDYSKVEYIFAKEKVTIICPKHGEFNQIASQHLSGCGCPQCNHYTSKQEEEIYQYIVSKIGKENVISGDRTVLDGSELDIFIPELKIGIEFNGLYWHNTNVIDKNYHLNKLNKCKEKGIRLLQIFEDEYYEHKEIVLKKIEHILGFQQDLPRIMGRKCLIRQVDMKTAKVFLNNYHIQGFSPSTIYLGGYYNEELVGIMSFKKENKDSNNWELSRFASNFNYIFQGLGGKLFKYFIRNYNYNEIKSFADRRWTVDEENNIYVQLGFKKDKYTNIEYRYYNPKAAKCKRIHKFNCRIHILNRKYGLPLTMTEREMTTKLGYSRIYDCGLIKYKFIKDT